MDGDRNVPLITQEGVRGSAEPREPGRYLVRLEGGTEFEVDADLLVRQDDNSLYLPLSQSELERYKTAQTGPIGRQKDQVVPRAEEQLHVGRRQVETGRVSVHKVVTEHEEIVDEPTLEEEVEVERVPIHQFVETVPSIRQEGDTTVIPLLEEVLVVEKRLRLREEIRIVRHRRETRHPERVALRSEDVEIERHNPVSEESRSEH